MKKKLAASIIILITLCFSDTNSKKSSISRIDTIIIPETTETSHFNLVSEESNQSLSWWKRNEANLIGAIAGSFFGAVGAGLIALYSIKRTHKNNIEIEKSKLIEIRKEKDKIYCGLLFMIISEIHYQKIDTEKIEKLINEFVRITKVTYFKKVKTE